MVYKFNLEETLMLFNDFNRHFYKLHNSANRSWNSDAQYVLHSENNERKVHLEEKR